MRSLNTYKNKVIAFHEKKMQALNFSVTFIDDLPRRYIWKVLFIAGNWKI